MRLLFCLLLLVFTLNLWGKDCANPGGSNNSEFEGLQSISEELRVRFDPGALLLTADNELKLAKLEADKQLTLLSQMKRECGREELPETQLYIEKLSMKLLKDSHLADRFKDEFGLCIQVQIDNQASNLSVNNRGQLIVPSSVLVSTKSEAELAFYIAHELAHHLLHHHARRVWLAKYTGTIEKTEASDEIKRNHELEADSLAVHLLVNAGYSTKKIISAVKKLGNDKGMYEHPETKLRFANLKSKINNYKNNIGGHRLANGEWVENTYDPIKAKIPSNVLNEVRIKHDEHKIKKNLLQSWWKQ
jgi:hypothetical protein